jgi:DNA-binding LacI/PurR family transcriptional regulator
MGKEAVRTAVRAIENPGLAPQIKIFDNDLIIRETT